MCITQISKCMVGYMVSEFESGMASVVNWFRLKIKRRSRLS